MREDGLRARILRRETLCGTFLKTPSYELVEILAMSGLDFVCLDGEHAPFDRARMDACIAIARALDFPCLVRIPEGTPAQILMTLDSGATGIVIPHCYSVEKARAVAKAARFGHGGRGYAGSTRWAGFATRRMPDVMAMTDETVVLGQIEEPEGVEAVEGIAAVDGMDGVFVGPADLAVCYGETSLDAAPVRAAMARVGEAARLNGKSAVTFAPDASTLPDLTALGINMMFFASEHSWILQGARRAAADFRAQTG